MLAVLLIVSYLANWVLLPYVAVELLLHSVYRSHHTMINSKHDHSHAPSPVGVYHIL